MDNCIARIAAKKEGQETMTGWQTIESAPADETILVWLPSFKLVRMARFSTGTFFGKRSKGWSVWLSGGSSNHLGKDAAPTHWMKLPEAPDL